MLAGCLFPVRAGAHSIILFFRMRPLGPQGEAKFGGCDRQPGCSFKAGTSVLAEDFCKLESLMLHVLSVEQGSGSMLQYLRYGLVDILGCQGRWSCVP